MASRRWKQPLLTATKERKASVLQPQEINPANNKNEPESIFTPPTWPQVSKGVVSFADTLSSALWDPEPHQISGLQNC